MSFCRCALNTPRVQIFYITSKYINWKHTLHYLELGGVSITETQFIIVLRISEKNMMEYFSHRLFTVIFDLNNLRSMIYDSGLWLRGYGSKIKICVTCKNVFLCKFQISCISDENGRVISEWQESFAYCALITEWSQIHFIEGRLLDY